jgi:hypothetical protein
MTPFAVTVLWVLTSLNNARQLVPVDKANLPSSITSPWGFSEGQCSVIRGKMEHPENYFCQRFQSNAGTEWSPPQKYTLWYWSYDPDEWTVGTPNLTFAECNEAREHFHLRGEAMDRQAADKNFEKHRPYCAPATSM